MNNDDWHHTVGRQQAEEAARRIAEREIRQQLNVDPDTDEAFARLVEERSRQLIDTIGRHLPANPLADCLIDWPALWAADDNDTDWLLDPILARGRAHALYAGAKTGKSYLILAACAALATGREFLGRPAGDPVRVLYLDFEMTAEDVRERLEEFGYGPHDDLSRLFYALLPTLPPLDTVDGGLALLEAVTALQVEFVVIDTTSRAIQGDENDADTLRAFYRCTGMLLKQAGVGWLRLDHAGKDVTRGQRGTSAKNDDVDVVARIERTDNGIAWVTTHRRMSWVPEKVDLAVTAGDDGVTRIAIAGEKSWPAGTAEVAAELDRLGVPVDATVRKAKSILREHGLGRRTTLLTAALKWRRLEAQRRSGDDVDLDELAGLNGVQGRETRAGNTFATPTGNDFRARAETPEISTGNAAGNSGKHRSAQLGNTVCPPKGTHGFPALADGIPDDHDDLF